MEGQAFQLVKEIYDINEIWKRLELSLGNVSLLLTNKFKEIKDNTPLWKIKNDEKLVQSVTKIENCMIELSSLAKKHKIEESLFHASNVSKIFSLIGEKRQYDVSRELLRGGKFSDKETWDEVIKYLESELQIKEMILLFEKSNALFYKENRKPLNELKSYNASEIKHGACENKPKCQICDEIDQIVTITSKGKQIINYFSCEKFVKMSPKERFSELK